MMLPKKNIFTAIGCLIFPFLGISQAGQARPNACNPAPDFSYYQSPCNPKEIRFFNLTPNIIVISWEFGDGTTSAGTVSPSVTYPAYGNYPVKLRIQGIGGCVDSITKIIPVTIQQDVLITTADTTVCAGTSVQLNSLPSLNFCWTASPELSNPLIRDPVVTPLGSATYYLTSQTTGSNLVVNGDFSAGNTGFVSDYTSQFPNTTQAAYWIGNNAQAWNVNFNACVEHTGATGNMMMVNGSPVSGDKVWSQTISVSPNTNYAFAVWIQSLAALNPARLRFSINGYLLGNNIVAGTTACQWNRFYATWNSGNSNSAVITIVNDNTVANGNDFALDDISFSQIFLKQDSINITVVPPPVISVRPDTAVCQGQAVPLSASGASGFSWSPATGLSNANIPNPVATPAVTTRYVVSGYDHPGCVGKDSVTITVMARPVISRIADTGFCTGAPPVTLFASAPGAVQYNWTPAAGLSNPAISNPVANPASSRRYYVEVTGGNGCKSLDSVYVSVQPSPTVNTRPDTSVCRGSGVFLLTTSTGASSFSWSPVAGLSDPHIANPVATPLVPTTYVVTAANSGCAAKDSVTISLKPSPVVSKSNDTIICHQGRAQLFATGGVNYLWSPVAGLSNPTIANPVASPSAPTRYYVNVTGSNGCITVDSVNIDWRPKPVFTVNPPSTAICIGDSTALTAAGADVYHWFSGSNILSPATASTVVHPLSTQQYAVALRHLFCGVSDTLRSTITVNPLPAVSALKSNDIDCSNAEAVLTATGAASYSWWPAGTISGANTPNPVVNPLTNTTYHVRGTSTEGCVANDSIRVLVLFNSTGGSYKMPDAFTPNHDGRNDCFGLKYWGVVQKLEFSIFNRWGQMVYHSKNSTACWDGSYKGVDQPSGTYVYRVKATTACGEVFRKGTVILMR